MKSINYKKIDHFAVAVRDIDEAIPFYRDVMGFELSATPYIQGKTTSMKSAVLSAGENKFSIVLVQGIEPESQVNRFIDKYGEGVQHPAFEVDDIEKVMKKLCESGVEFSTDLIIGGGIKQCFTRVLPHSGIFIELIERTTEKGFVKGSIENLFEQLENSLDW